MVDADFEDIKEQLRQARRRLDEAVALVGRTASSSSRYAGVRRDYEIPATSSRLSTVHDLKHCPVWNKAKGTPDDALCLTSCSKT